MRTLARGLAFFGAIDEASFSAMFGAFTVGALMGAGEFLEEATVASKATSNITDVGIGRMTGDHILCRFRVDATRKGGRLMHVAELPFV